MQPHEGVEESLNGSKEEAGSGEPAGVFCVARPLVTRQQPCLQNLMRKQWRRVGNSQVCTFLVLLTGQLLRILVSPMPRRFPVKLGPRVNPDWSSSCNDVHRSQTGLNANYHAFSRVVAMPLALLSVSTADT